MDGTLTVRHLGSANGCRRGLPHALRMACALEKNSRSQSKSKFSKESPMTSLRNRVLAIAAFGLATIFVTATPAAAQNAIQGSFTLPEEVRWQGATLPAGDYTFSMKSVAAPSVILLDGPNGGAFVAAIATDQLKPSNRSVLIVEHRGDMRVVRELDLPQIGVRLHYPQPKASKDDKLLAQGTATKEEALISMAKK
jgi:hypothetical protein